jgi:peptidyl-prolyl cis-trans isomerase C
MLWVSFGQYHPAAAHPSLAPHLLLYSPTPIIKETLVSNSVVRLLKEPLIQFLLIGACIYGAYGLFAPPEEGDLDTTVLVDVNRINGFVAQWSSRWNRPPTREELDALINTYVREEILYRQAVAMGLDEDDPVTRRRLAQRLEFLTSDLALVAEPDEAELERYFQDNIDQFRDPDLISFIQVFFDPDARDEATLDDAREALVELKAAGVPHPETLQAGDRFMLPNYFASATELEVRKRLGGGFAESLLGLDPGAWHGPVLSGFGVHLVYVFERLQAPAPVLADVRLQVLEGWQRQQVETFNQKFYQGLKDRYTVIVEDDGLAPGSLLQPAKRPSTPAGAGQ